MKISYAVTCFNELEEIQRLIPYLLKHKREEDEIVVLWDDKGDFEVWKYLASFPKITLEEGIFNKDFAEWKNKLTSLCSGNIIMQLDADEIPHENLIKTLPFILEENPQIDIFLVPRVNIVKGIGLSHIERWGWKISKSSGDIQEKEFDLSNPKDLDEYNLLKMYDLIIEEK